MDRKWYAIRTKSRQEDIAALHYQQQRFTVYLPKVETTRRHARKSEQVLRPFFPGYLFLHLAPLERDWTAISSTVGAIGPVRFDMYYPAMPDRVIDRIRERENGQGFIAMRSLGNAAFKPRERVLIEVGDQEVAGLFVCFRGEDRVLVLMDILQRELKVEVAIGKMKKE